ncbi:MAG: leucyl aminopeptidase [Candidatus Pacebacteria bacterium]|nr:leucyl aminopeptidase [Candidatus Paceibacterota bacterium]
MKITVTAKKASTRPKGVVRITLSEKGQTKFIEADGVTELRIKVGAIKKDERRKFVKAVRRVVRTAQQYQCEKVAIDLNEFTRFTDLSGKELGSTITQNLVMAAYEFRKFKTKPKDGWKDIKELFFASVSAKTVSEGAQEGIVIGEMVDECRTIANTPGGDMTPTSLAAEAKRLAKGTGASVRVLGRRDMERLSMGAILGVAKGSVEEPKFIIMEYKGGKKSERPVVLVGKGVTYDTGGINLKPSSALLGMHFDMSGGSAVMATVALVAKLKLKKNVIGLIPSVENMASGSAVRPGDVLTTMSGKTVEVLNTDAEGRLILADALTYAKRYNPKHVIDVATLTGASLVALGQHTSVVMSRDDAFASRLIELGEKSGDYLWRLPLWEEYEEEVRGQVADIANLSTKNPQYGGAINGGIFLLQFAKDFIKDCSWAHIDIAPRMTTIPSDNLATGAAGEPVRLLTRFIADLT